MFRQIGGVPYHYLARGRGNKGLVAAPADPAKAIFSDGSNGFYYDFANQGSLYQDAAGTTPVTAAGQQIGLVKDQSPNGNNATQSGSARPAWQANGSGLFDGLDDNLLSTFTSLPSVGSLLLMGTFSVPTADGICGALSANQRLYLGVATTAGLVFANLGAASRFNGNAVGAAKTLIGTTYDGTTIRLYQGAAQVNSQAQGSSLAGQIPIRVGALNNGGNASNFMTGSINKALAISRPLALAEIASIITYWSAH